MNTIRAKQQGVTLLELIAVLTIVCILAGQAIPSMHSFYRRYVVSTTTTQLIRQIKSARHMALSLGETISLQGGRVGSEGESIWRTVSLAKQSNQALTEVPMSTFQIPPSILLTWRGFPSSTELQFQPSGNVTHSNGTFLLRHRQDKHFEVRVIINKAGRVRVENEAR